MTKNNGELGEMDFETMSKGAEIVRLADAGWNAIADACEDDSSANEVIGACLMIAFMAVEATKAMGGNVEAFRAPLALLYSQLPPVDKTTAN